MIYGRASRKCWNDNRFVLSEEFQAEVGEMRPCESATR